jgi:hypothetical protein
MNWTRTADQSRTLTAFAELRTPVGKSGANLTPADPIASNLTTMFDLLADIATPTSIECLEPFTRYELHFVGWRAIRSIFGIDRVLETRLVEQSVGTHTHMSVKPPERHSCA